MGQQARTVNELITQAYYQIGEFGVGEEIDGFAISLAFNLFNQQLDFLSAANVSIPFLNTINFDMVVGQDTYSISTIGTPDVESDRIIDLVYCNFILSGQIVYPIEVVDKATFYNNMHISDLQSQPSLVFLENQVQTSYIKFYPAPDQAYPIILKVKQMIDQVNLNSDISEIPPYYERYMRFAIARELLQFYPSSNWSETAEKDYQMMYDTIFGNTADLTIEPSIILNRSFNTWYPTILSLP